MEELIQRGAEADIYRGIWFDEVAVYKIRQPKRYRNSILDSKIRASRTAREALLLSEAKAAGVSVPTVFFVDAGSGTLVMQYVQGEQIKDVLTRQGENTKTISREIGRIIAFLHRNDIVHGDLTTSNFLLGRGVFLLDFGLASHSTRVEDKAVDLHLMKEVLRSAHSGISEKVFSNILREYEKTLGRSFSESVLRKIENIEGRRRYSSVG